jgi:hypothetical protein
MGHCADPLASLLTKGLLAVQGAVARVRMH